MRRGLIGGTAAAFVVAVAFMVAPAAWAASPQDICNDLKDGQVDGTYTLAEWQAFFRDPTVQGYCTPVSVVIPPPVTPTVPTTTTTSTSTAPPPVALSPAPAPTTAAVKGAQHTVTSKPRPTAPKSAPAPATLGATKTKGSLPFTGADLAVFAVVGLALIAIGFALRSTTRRRPPSQST